MVQVDLFFTKEMEEYGTTVTQKLVTHWEMIVQDMRLMERFIPAT